MPRFSPSLRSKRRAPHRPLLPIFLSFLLLLLLSICLLFSTSLSLTRLPSSILRTFTDNEIIHPPTNLSSPASARVTLWTPSPCRGVWSTQPARDSPSAFPYAIVRDASVDRRPRSRAILGARTPVDAVRVVLYVTTHLSARHTREKGVVSVGGGELVGEVEYVNWVSSMIVPKPKGRYRKRMTTKFGSEVSEWQIGIRLEARRGLTEGAVVRAVEANVALNVSLLVVRYDDKVFPMDVRMQMSCVMGWTLPGLEGREETCGPIEEQGRMAEGSILLSGSALYGNKKRDPRYYREVANFAARGLMGAVRYDYVAMSVVSDVSVSDMDLHCGEDVVCRRRMEEVNEGLLMRIRDVVEEEMEIIGVPRSLFPRLLLIPTCRLGSHSNGTEKDDPCSVGKRYGQYHATFFSYAILAPYFKWAVSHDIDEYLSVVPLGWSIDSVPAAQILDSADRDMGRKGDLVFQWLNFRVKSLNDTRTLSTQLIHGNIPKLENKENDTGSKHCYDRRRVSTGKSAVRCDVGLGFTIHHPVTEKVGFRMDINQGDRRSRRLRTWHARLGSASSKCDYIPPDE